MTDDRPNTVGDSDDYRTSPRGLKHDDTELLAPLGVLFAYALPAVCTVSPPSVGPAWFIPTIGSVIILAVATLVPVSIRYRLGWFPQSGKWEPDDCGPPLDLSDVSFDGDRDIDSLRLEYSELCEEARYRDRLLLRTGYFALAVVGVLGGVFTAVPPVAQSFVAMLASLVMFAFAVAVNSYKDSRDANWDRIARIEGSVPEFQGILTTFHSMRHVDRRMLNRVSLSSYLYILTLFVTLLAVVVYLATVLGWRLTL